jgi:short-subunit dehydrogenase
MGVVYNETVLITGASSGIGLELARCFAADHASNPGQCRLILLARNTAALEALAAELQHEFKIRVTVLTADLSRVETTQFIFDRLKQDGITVDILVNNAGFGLMGEFSKLSLPQQLEMLQVNVTALSSLTGLFLPAMIQRKRGGILNVGSVAGFQPGPNMAVYYATKAYVLSFTEALAEELAGSGLNVSVLCPGPTESNFWKVARGGKARKLQIPKMSGRTVALYGYQAFRRGKYVAVSGLMNKLLTLLVRIMPRILVRKIARRYNQVED